MYYIANGYSLISRKLLIFRQCGLIEDILNKIAYTVREMCDHILDDNFVSKGFDIIDGIDKYGYKLNVGIEPMMSLSYIRIRKPVIPRFIENELRGIIDARIMCQMSSPFVWIYYLYPIKCDLPDFSWIHSIYKITKKDKNRLYFIDGKQLEIGCSMSIGMMLYSGTYTKMMDILDSGIEASDYEDDIIDAKNRILAINKENNLGISIIGPPQLVLSVG
jgi:hypothetical protein